LDLPYSSSEIRRELAAGKRPQEVPAAVLEYIQCHRLYGVKNRD
jgi:nicotinic acid mononucleotide adenylyltransferase